MLSCLFMTNGTTAKAAKPAGSVRATSADHSTPQTWTHCVVSKLPPEVQSDHMQHMSISTPHVVILCVVSKPATGVRQTHSHHKSNHQDEMDHGTNPPGSYPAVNTTTATTTAAATPGSRLPSLPYDLALCRGPSETGQTLSGAPTSTC